MHRTIFIGALVAGILVLPVEMAQAQVSAFKGTLTDLAPGDYALAQQAAETMRGPSAQVGDRETWSNPETGNSGSVTLLDVFQFDNLPCQRIRHDVDIKQRPQPVQYIIERCQMPDGTWKMR